MYGFKNKINIAKRKIAKKIRGGEEGSGIYDAI
jgi:hypothetical protein